MKKQYQMSSMIHSSDVWCAPAYQSAAMTANSAIELGTALLAVSFLFVSLLDAVVEGVRIILQRLAKP